MDRAFCISLNTEIYASDAVEFYNSGLLNGKSDFACLDHKCRASYIFANIDNLNPKVPPYFRTAKKPKKQHIHGCRYEIEEKQARIIKSKGIRAQRGEVSESSNYIFKTSRPSNYFTRPLPNNNIFFNLNHIGRFYYLRSDMSLPYETRKTTNKNIYSVYELLKNSYRPYKELHINGETQTFKTLFRPIDNNSPDKTSPLVYCGLATVVSYDDDQITFKFGRSFNIDEEQYTATVEIKQSVFDKTDITPIYYSNHLKALNLQLAQIEQDTKKIAFLYIYGKPKYTSTHKELKFNITNLDMLHIEQTCTHIHLFHANIYKLENNKHYFEHLQS